MAELAGLPTTTITTAREIAGKIREEQAAQESAQHADHNDAQTEESCTQYNVLKVARRSFLTSADAGKADFYERGALPGSHAWPLATIGCRANFVQPLTRLGSSIITSDQRSQV